jgi:cell wall-associated NlpC family hydrolase
VTATVLGVATLAAPALASDSVGGTAAAPPSNSHAKRTHAKRSDRVSRASAEASGGASSQATTSPTYVSGQSGANAEARSVSQTGATSLAPPKSRHAPITARTPNTNYKGPVYQLTISGQVVPYQPPTAAGSLEPGLSGAVGSAADTKPKLLVPGRSARLVNGLAAAPMEAPGAIQKIVWAGDELVGLPYIYGGGHGSWRSPGYDCSGTVSYALHAAGLLASPEDSTEFESFGARGVGEWVSVFANSGHAYMDVAGLRLDTSSANDPSGLQGPRWRPLRPQNAGFTLRHPVGL